MKTLTVLIILAFPHGHVKTRQFMLIYIVLFLYLANRCSPDLNIKDAGIASINEGDIAIIFYLTLENICDDNVEISVRMTQCCEKILQDETETDCNSMYLIGGSMGMLYKTSTRNITLVYPNLYFFNRQGTCTIAVKYTTQKFEKILTRDIEFKTNSTIGDQNQCKSADMDSLLSCSPMDCVIKYSGSRSFFNPSSKTCELAQICSNEPLTNPIVAYSWIDNKCMNLNEIVTKEDLELLENNQVDTSDDDSLIIINGICHHGDTDNNGQCQCQADWKTTLTDDSYEPSLTLYHMCNIESGGWNCVNKNKIQTTAIIIAIFSLTIATKILILMCILNWCYKHFRNPKETIACTDTMDPKEISQILMDDTKSSLDKCICGDLKKIKSQNLFSEVVNVSYYPCAPSTISSLKVSVDTEKSKKCAKCHSHLPSSTTSSTVPISFETDTDTSTDEESNASDDYEIEFEEEQEYCGDDHCPQSKKRSVDRVTEGYTEYTTSIDNGSRRDSKQSQNDSVKSKTPSKKAESSTKDLTEHQKKK